MVKKIKLLDRILIGSIFPESGSFSQLIVRKDIIEKVKVNQSDISEYDIKTTEGSADITWNAKGVEDVKEMDFTDLECAEIKKCLTVLSNTEKLTNQHLDLWEQFNS